MLKQKDKTNFKTIGNSTLIGLYSRLKYRSIVTVYIKKILKIIFNSIVINEITQAY